MSRGLRPVRVGMLLGLVLVLGTLARAPGLFWGYKLFGTEVVTLHPDEPRYSLGGNSGTGVPGGLETQVRLVTAGLERVGLAELAHGPHYEFFVGRIVSLVYGVLTLLVVFRLAWDLSGDPRVGLVAALFLALADLHVTYSHIGVPDSAATFWFYAALAAAFTAFSRASRGAALVSAICTGAAAAMRFQFVSAIPLAWWVARSDRKLVDGVLALATGVAAFFLFNGLLVVKWGHLGVETVFLPFVYTAVLLVGVGLPVFLLAGYGLVHALRVKARAVRRWRALLEDHHIPIGAAVLAAFVQICAAGIWAHRQAVVQVPALVMLGAYGAVRLAGCLPRGLLARIPAPALLALVAVYLAVQVGSVQAHFVDDPLERAGRWLRVRVPAGEVVSTVLKVPPEYPRTAEWNASFLVLSGQEYRRYLFKDFWPVPGGVSLEDVEAGKIWGGNPQDAARFRQLFAGELPYRRVKKIGLRFYTPELLLTSALWFPPPHLYEVLIFERRRERERVVELLTPSRRDYLLTLNTGRLWGPDPGQRIEVSVNAEPVRVVLREGHNHVLVPRALVTAPLSRLRLSSDAPLPHVPPDLVERVRPLGEEFVIDSLLDGDLMPDGFHPAEVRPDGATYRWSTGAGRVLLPVASGSRPWKRLAIRLAGRPAGAPPQPVVFFLDGVKVGEGALSERELTLQLPVPARAARGEGAVAVLDIVSPPARDQPGVAVFGARLTRAERFRRSPGPGETVSVSAGGLTLRGDLLAPNGGGRAAVLLVHGANVLGRRHGLYRGLARRLVERGYWVLNLDLRGYGESDDPARVASARDLDFPEDLASAVSVLRTRTGVTDVTVVGHSFGAGVALAHAARDARVGRVVAISPGRRAYERLLNSAAGRQAIRDRMVKEMGLREGEFPVELVDAVVTPIIIDTYAAHPYRQPVLLIDGEREEAADLAFLRDMFRRLRAERKAYVTIPRADHYFGIERRVEDRDPVTLDALADVIDGWIREGDRWVRPRN